MDDAHPNAKPCIQNLIVVLCYPTNTQSEHVDNGLKWNACHPFSIHNQWLCHTSDRRGWDFSKKSGDVTLFWDGCCWSVSCGSVSLQDRTLVSEVSRKKERELVAKEIERLRSSIQTVCRSALPLGKIMDYIQEDMDSMQNELQTWRKENKENAQALLQEQRCTFILAQRTALLSTVYVSCILTKVKLKWLIWNALHKQNLNVLFFCWLDEANFYKNVLKKYFIIILFFVLFCYTFF